MTTGRRAVLAGLAAMAAAPAAAQIQNAAPPGSDADAWTAYAARLQGRLRDAGRGVFDASAAAELLRRTNAARAQADAPPLVWHDELSLAARAHAADLAERSYVEHLAPEGFDPSHRFWLLSRRTIGSPSENIAFHRGAPAPGSDHLMAIWRGSGAHWANLLRPTHSHAAFGVVRSGERTYAVGLFMRPSASFAEDLPLFPKAEAEMRRVLDTLPPDFHAFIEAPEGARQRQGRLRVAQVAVRHREPEGGYLIAGGPIFIVPDVAPT